MDAVKAWAAGLCAVSMGCVLLKMLAPKGGMGKLIHLIIAAFFVCCFAAPLMKLTALEEWELPELSSSTQAQALEQIVTQQLERQIDTALGETARTVLSNYGIEMTKISAQTDTSEDGGIYITRITLYLDKQNISQAAAAKQVMEQRLGMEVFVEEWDG